MTSSLIAATRERSFGGKAGIWFKKRKRLPPTSELYNLTPLTLIGAKNSTVRSQQQKLQSAGAVIGWDDIRCRPIYSSDSDGNSSLKYFDSDDGFDEEGDDEEDNQKEKMYNASKQSKETKEDRERKDKKMRSYGRKRQIVVADGDIESTTHLYETSSATYQNPTTIEASSMGNSTSTTRANATFDLQDDKIIATPNPRRISTESRDISNHRDIDSVFEFKEETECHQDRRIRVTTRTPKHHIAASSTETSLSEARAFFRRLDSEQLNLTQVPSTTPQRGRNIRTQHKVSVSNEEFSKEYSDYAAVCRDSLVSPLSKEDYVSNRSAYFRSTEMYDGFLDE